MKAYKYRVGIEVKNDKNESLFERDLNTLSKNLIYAPTIKELNDPTEGFYNDKDFVQFFKNKKSIYSLGVLEKYEELIEKFNTVGILSLSKNVTNELLWAYYSSGHTGYAIEYDIDIIKDSFNFHGDLELVYNFDVEYENSIPNIQPKLLFNKDMNVYLKKFIGNKSKSWLHEEEFRVIFNDYGLNNIDYRAVTGIYFGFRMKNTEMEYIMELLKGRNIQYYKMNLEENSYRFYPKPITDKYKNVPKYKIEDIKDIDPFYLTQDYLKEDFKYLEKIKKNISIVKTNPLISEIYQLIVVHDKNNIILKVFCYNKKHIFPTREFKFILS